MQTWRDSWRAFTPEWFERWQWILLLVLDEPVLGRLFRWMLRIRKHDVGHRCRIVKLLPHAYVVERCIKQRRQLFFKGFRPTTADFDAVEYVADIRTHWKYSKRIYFSLLPLWWMLHAWDWAVADRFAFAHALSAGFVTLDFYPDANPETTTVDGPVARGSVNETFATIRAGAGNEALDNTNQADCPLIQYSSTLNQLAKITRGIMLFDTSTIGTATVTAAVMSVWVNSKFDDATIAPTYDAYTSTPASNTALANSDYANVGTTSQTGAAITHASVTTGAYNALTFNATGRGNVNRSGISKFGIREAKYDVANVNPTGTGWTSGGRQGFNMAFADQAALTNDPKLTVTFNTVVTATDSLRVALSEHGYVRSNQITAQDSLRIALSENPITPYPKRSDPIHVGLHEGATVLHSTDPFSRKVLLELNGRNNGWTDVSSDVIYPVSCERGMGSGAVTDRVADSGSMSFTLNNSTTNSAHLNGYYSPDNANCRAGFGLGIGVQWQFTQGFSVVAKFTGRIDSIKPIPGRYGIRITRVTAVDYMDNLAKQKMNGVPVQIGQLASQVFSTIIASLGSDAPAIATIYPSTDVLPFTLDNTQDEAVSVMEELDKLAKSEYGYIYVLGNGAIVFESRQHRFGNRTNAINFTELQIADMELEYQRDRAINAVQVIIHPKRVDANPTTVLYAITTTTKIEPGETYSPFGPYRDPAQQVARVGGTSMQTPVATTDFLMNSQADGLGTDLTASCSVVASFGGNGVSFDVTNTGTVTGYLTKLQCRGKGVYDYDNLVQESNDATLQSRVGEVKETLDQTYASDGLVAAELALYILNTQKQGLASIDRVSFYAAGSALIDACMFRDIGDRIGLNETMTGVSTATTTPIIPGFHIQGVSYVDDGVRVTVGWTLAVADNTAYWYLEIAGMSELGITTRLGYGAVVGHTDVAHGDVAHVDVAHSDSAHVDTHTDDAHQDSPTHSDTAHTDSAHSDTSHSDVAHSDSVHSDVAHGDGSTHADDPFQDFEHDDSHADFTDSTNPHGDGHADSPHIDEAHEDGTFHVDSAHSDVAHGDTAHSDVAHSDVAHGDIAHQDTTGHADVAHGDVAHADVAHGDTAHSDVTHADTPHGDAN